MTMFDKTHIRETLLAMERADIAAAQRSYDAYFGEATTVGDRVFDPEHAATVVRDRPVLERIEALARPMSNKTFASVWDAIEDTAAEAENIKLIALR